MITATNEDNMLMMARYPDDYFDLAIVDPPYGVNLNVGRNKQDMSKKWDTGIPEELYFKELFRVSKNYIIWGGNYFSHLIPASRCFIYWDKPNIEHLPTMADGELALTSFKSNAKKYRTTSALYIGKKIHPTQKPVKLYEYCLMNYAKEGDKILDTHRGSASLDIACHNLGFDLVTCELDTDYFNDGNKRLEQHQQQQVMKF
jgi:site-specific DNA-methyltransferase (adenine-specific)